MKNLPDKIYLNLGELSEEEFNETDFQDLSEVTWSEDDVQGKNIEYVHKDAFIEKACEWIREFNNHHYIMRYSDSCEPPLSEVTEWFKNYMKGE